MYKTGKEHQKSLPHIQDCCECPKVICMQDQIPYLDLLIEVWVVIPVIIDHTFMNPSGFHIL